MPDTNSELTSFDRRMLRQFQEEYEAEEAVLSRLKAEARAIDERNAGRLHDLDRQKANGGYCDGVVAHGEI